ncbi:MAG: hypothetical protein ACHQM6_00720 [Candidatus Kapaibacterium sp.]
MKPTIIKVLIAGLLIGSGCDQVLPVPAGSGSSDFLAWMQTMTKIRVSYSGLIDLQYSLKQSTIDPGNNSDVWMPRELAFSNWDSTYTISWQDSQFQTRSCFVFRQIDPTFTLSSDCGTQSLIRGVYHASAKNISDLICMFENYHGGSDPNNYQEQDASLNAPIIDMDTFGDDSIVFTMKSWEAGSLAIGYNYDERAPGNYSKQMHLNTFDVTGASYPNVCRVVFSTK